MTDHRKEQLTQWLEKTLNISPLTLTPMIGDASFRRYFRFSHEGKSYVAMDAPPDKEPIKPFIAIAKTFSNAHIRVPKIFASDPALGFLWTEDFGDRLYVKELTLSNAETLYLRTFDPLIRIQKCTDVDEHTLPHFNEHMMRQELQNFSHWFLERHVKVDFPQPLLKDTFQLLVSSAAAQPQLCVHRDYHSRNLMVLPNNEVGVLDFQDAVWGPITYDLVSLLRDCYITWPREAVERWVKHYHTRAMEEKLPVTESFPEFMRWFDLMGIQRHLKAIFIFSRKFLRDESPLYLSDIPRGMNYILEVSQNYPELKNFSQVFRESVVPAYKKLSV